MKIKEQVLKIWFIVAMASAMDLTAQNPVPTDSTAKYDWINWQLNGLQYYDTSALAHLHQVWHETDKRKLVIVDVGDSHLQSDIYPGTMRKSLQALKGDGGRGMLFAYSAAKTYSPLDYSTSHTGQWTYGKGMIVPPKVPLGVSGMSCHTTDLTASLNFKFGADVSATYTRLKLFVKKQPNSFDIQLEVSGQTKLVSVAANLGDSIPYIEVDIPPVNRTISLRLQKNDASQNEFEFYGMSLETATNSGVILHNGGVGGARYQSILFAGQFVTQLASLNPDLVIVDFGTNDYLYDDSIKLELDSEVTEVVKRVKLAAPRASIILTTAHDLFYKGRNIRSGPKFAELIYKVARQQHCAIYDWYWIFGGRKAMLKWRDAGIGRTDEIHLTQKGYILKGQLFFDAMRHAMDRLDTSHAPSFLFDMDSLKQRQAMEAANDTTPEPKPEKHSLASASGRTHLVKKGESLGLISHKYGVTVSALMKANGLKKATIHPGQKLIIPKK